MIWLFLYLIIAFIVSVLWFRYSIKDDLISGATYEDAKSGRLCEAIFIGSFWIFTLAVCVLLGLVKLVEITAHVKPEAVQPMSEEVKKIIPSFLIEQKIASLLKASFGDNKFDFACLTPKKRRIIGDEESFDQILIWVAERLI